MPLLKLDAKGSEAEIKSLEHADGMIDLMMRCPSLGREEILMFKEPLQSKLMLFYLLGRMDGADVAFKLVEKWKKVES